MSAASSTSPTPDTATDDVDVAILGGGIAGLTLALQLERTIPTSGSGGRAASAIRCPRPPTRWVSPASRCRRTTCGTSSASRSTSSTSSCTSSGCGCSSRAATTPTSPAGWSTDRSPRLHCRRTSWTAAGWRTTWASWSPRPMGCTSSTGRVTDVELGESGAPHLVEVRDARRPAPASRRAGCGRTGRAGLLKRKLGLAKPVPHHANSSWFRIAHPSTSRSGRTTRAGAAGCRAVTGGCRPTT